MGLPVPQGLEGRVLEEALDPEWARAHPVTTIAPGNQRARPRGLPEAGIGGDEARELRELGYVE
jgi:hypothetical protein